MPGATPDTHTRSPDDMRKSPNGWTVSEAASSWLISTSGGSSDAAGEGDGDDAPEVTAHDVIVNTKAAIAIAAIRRRMTPLPSFRARCGTLSIAPRPGTRGVWSCPMQGC